MLHARCPSLAFAEKVMGRRSARLPASSVVYRSSGHGWIRAMARLGGRPLIPSSAMRAGHAVVAMVFVACGTKATTPAGPVGKPMDFRSKLDPAVAQRAPTDERATRHEMGADLHGVKAKLVWRTFDDGPHKYVLSTQWEVVTPSPSITIEPIDTVGMMPTNAGSPDAVNEKIVLRVRWHDNSSASVQFGEASFDITADGHGRPI